MINDDTNDDDGDEEPQETPGQAAKRARLAAAAKDAAKRKGSDTTQIKTRIANDQRQILDNQARKSNTLSRSPRGQPQETMDPDDADSNISAAQSRMKANMDTLLAARHKSAVGSIGADRPKLDSGTPALSHWQAIGAALRKPQLASDTTAEPMDAGLARVDSISNAQSQAKTNDFNRIKQAIRDAMSRGDTQTVNRFKKKIGGGD